MRYFLLSVIVLWGCTRSSDQPQSPAQTVAVDTADVLTAGQLITKEAFATLSSLLEQALTTGGVSNALRFCNIRAIPLTDSLAFQYGVTLRRASHRPRNTDNRADSLEMASIHAYLKQIQAEQELKPKIYAAGSQISYHAPIRIPGALCLSCHGQPQRDITESDLSTLQQLYPGDEATGFDIGELRGIWSIRFPPKYFSTGHSNMLK